MKALMNFLVKLTRRNKENCLFYRNNNLSRDLGTTVKPQIDFCGMP